MINLSHMYSSLLVASIALWIALIPFTEAVTPELRDFSNDIYNYSVEFLSDETYLVYQPNIFAGIAAAFHEFNTGPSTATSKAHQFFQVILTNETASVARLLATGSMDNLGSIAQRFNNYVANASALAAYRAANPSSTMDDYLLSIGADPNNQQDMRARTAMSGTPLGFAGSGGLSSYALITVAESMNITAVGVSSTSSSYRNRTQFINFRGGAAAEFPMMMNLGFNRADLRCTSFLLLHIDLGEYLPILTKGLFEANGYTYTTVSRGSELYDLGSIAIALAKNPSCIMFVDIPQVVEGYVPQLQFLTTFDISKKNIIGFNYNYQATFSPPASFANMYITQIMPHPEDPTSKFAARAKAALKTYFAAVPAELYGNASESNCSVVNASVTARLPEAVGGVCRIINYMKPSPFLEYQMVEGYAIGRLIIAAATSTVGVVNTTTIRSTVYRQRMLLFEDFDLGPYTDECSAGGVFPCFCTSGVRTVYSSRVNATNGRSYPITDRLELGEKNVATSTAPYSECLSGVPSSRRSINIVYLDLDASAAAVEGTATQFPQYEAFSTTLSKILAKFSLNDFYASGSIYVVRRTLTLAEYQSASTVAQIVSDLSSRYQPFVVATSFGVSEQLANASAAVLRAGFVEMRGASLRTTPITHPLYPNEMSVDASLAELIHGAAASSVAGGFVMIVADTSVNADLAVKSLHTFGVAEASVVVSPDGNGVDSVAAHVAQGGAVLVASLTTSTVRAVLSKVTGLSGSPAGAVYIAGPEPVVYLAATQAAAGAGGAIPSVSVRFASGMKEWWATSTLLGQRTAAVQYDDGMGGNTTQTFLSNPIHARAAFFAWTIYSVAKTAVSLAASLGGAPTFPNTLNNVATVDIASVQVGPFSNTTCATASQLASPDRTCQCQNGLSAVYVHSLRAMMDGSTAAESPSLRMGGCGITYAPLPTTSSDRTSPLIGAVVGSVGGILLLAGGAVVVFLCCTGRSNRTAPKDEALPFTVVFTDIQASTTLWARAPSAMVHALDLHHDIMRDVLAAHNGYEVKTIGDSFMIAFQSPLDAVRFSVAIQHALFVGKWSPSIDETYRHMILEKLEEHIRDTKDSDVVGHELFPEAQWAPTLGSPNPSIEHPPNAKAVLSDMEHTNVFYVAMRRQILDDINVYERNWCGVRVRVGVHTGMGNIKKDPVSGGYDYYGTVVNTAARVEGVGHGGQILLTDSTFNEVSHIIADCGCTVKDLGEQPLRGLDAPVRLYQLNLTNFGGRVFLPLRLDVENDAMEDEDSSSAESVGSSESLFSEHSTMFTHVNDYYNPDLYARCMSRRKRHGSDTDSVAPSLLRVDKTHTKQKPGFALEDSYLVLSTVISTMAAAKGSDLMTTLAKSWHVRLSKEKKLLNWCKKRAVRNKNLQCGAYPTSLTPEAINKFHVVELLEKVHPVVELGKKKRSEVYASFRYTAVEVLVPGDRHNSFSRTQSLSSVGKNEQSAYSN